MEKKVLFREVQKFRSAILWIPFAIMVGFLLHKIIQQVIFGVPFGDKPMSNVGLIGFFIFFWNRMPNAILLCKPDN